MQRAQLLTEKTRKQVERRAEHERRKQNMHSSMAIEAETTMNSNEEEGTVSLSPVDHDIERHLVHPGGGGDGHLEPEGGRGGAQVRLRWD